VGYEPKERPLKKSREEKRNFKKEGAAGHGDTEGQVSSSVDGAKPFLEYKSKR